MPHVQDVETQLEPVTLRAGLNGEFLQDPEVHVVVPRIRFAEAVRDLTAVGTQIAVLVDERVQLVPLLLRRHDSAAGKGVWRELYLALAPGDVDQVVAALAVAVDVTGVNERVTVASGASEAVPLARLQEHPDAGLERRRPGLRVSESADDPVALTEFGVAEFWIVRVAPHRQVLPESKGDLRRLQGVPGVREAVSEPGLQPEREALAQLGGDIERMPGARVVEHVQPAPGAAKRGIEAVVGPPEVRPPIGRGKSAHRRPQVGVPNVHSVDILPVDDLEGC